MSDGAKTALILGGAAVAAYVLFLRPKAATTPLAPTSTTTSATMSTGAPLSPSPGAPISNGPAVSTGISVAGHSVSATTIAKVVAAPVYYPTVAVIGGAKAAYHYLGSLF